MADEEYALTTGEPEPLHDLYEEHREARHQVMSALSHESFNLYADMGMYLPYPAPTWWLLEENQVPNVLDTAPDALSHMVTRLAVQPALIGQVQTVYRAKYEVIAYGRGWRTPEGVIDKRAVGWIDFLAGVPYGAIEMLAVVAEAGTEPQDMPSKPGKGPTPAVHKPMFKNVRREFVLYNYIWLAEKGVKPMAKPVPLGEKAETLWWLRVNLFEDEKYPYPGEFVGLSVRLFPNLPWGRQQSNPYLFSGNWVDTIYYTSGIVMEVIREDDDISYKVKWHGRLVTAKATDYAEYRTNDRVTIIKSVRAAKPSQQYRDDDTEHFDSDEWLIAPITFYGIGLE